MVETSSGYREGCGQLHPSWAGHTVPETRILCILLVLLAICGVSFSVSCPGGLSGSGTPDSPCMIATCTDLQSMSGERTASYALSNDIDCTYDTQNPAGTLYNGGAGFAPVCAPSTPFTGTFNGNGHNITGLYINRPSQNYVGLFAATNGANISNVGLVNSNITGQSGVSGLIGQSISSTISNSYSTGNVIATIYYAGGLIGWGRSITISGSYSTVNVSSKQYAGGLISYTTSSTISGSYSTGNVSSSQYAGGLLGYSSSITISGSYSAVNVSGNYDVGGLIGQTDCHNPHCMVSNSYSTGNVSGNHYVGGLIGRMMYSDISYSYSTGNVNDSGGGAGNGGFIGYSDGGSSISDSFSTGNTVSAGSDTGGFMGHIDPSDVVGDSFWDLYLSGQSICTGNSGNVSGCTGVDDDGSNIAYFYNSSNAPLSSWDFTDIWLANSGAYPTFMVPSAPSSPSVFVNFTDPTPASGIMLNRANIAVNVTVSENATGCNLTLNSTTYAMGVFNADAATCANYTLTALSDGFYVYNVTCSASGASNYTETRNVTVALPSPAVTLGLPANASTVTTSTVTFGFTVVDNLSATLNCSLYLGGAVNQTNASVANNTPTNFTVRDITPGQHNWSVACTNAANKTGSSEVRKLSRRPEPSSATVPPAGCSGDGDCTAAQACSGAKCVAVPCSCGIVENHQCVKTACCADSDCAPNQVCNSGSCVAVQCACGVFLTHQCVAYACCSDSDCRQGSACRNNVCVPAFECASDSQCAPGQYCDLSQGLAGGSCRNKQAKPEENQTQANQTQENKTQENQAQANQTQQNISAPANATTGKPVTLTVTNGSGPCAYCKLTWVSPSGAMGSGTTDADGKLSLTLNESGKYTVSLPNGSRTISIYSALASKPAAETPLATAVYNAVAGPQLWLGVVLVAVIALAAYLLYHPGRR